MSLYQLYAIVTAHVWESLLKQHWPDAPLVGGYRVLVFTNQDYESIKQQYSSIEFKDLALESVILAMEAGEDGGFVCDLDKVKKVINHFSPPDQELGIK